MSTFLPNFLFLHHHHHHHHRHRHHLSPSYKCRLHFQYRFIFFSSSSSFPLLLPTPRFTISKSKSSKFDFSPPNFDNGDDTFRRRRRRGRRTKRRQVRWWSDQVQDDDDDDDDGVVESGFLEQLVDNLWILQVFKSYGWFLPIILVSYLIATGPKAFLMASGIPFGLSVVIFAFQKLSKWLEGSPKPRKKRKKRAKPGRTKAIFFGEEDTEEDQSGMRNKKRDFRYRVAQSNGSFYDKGSSSKVGYNSFGGWDELVREDETRTSQKPSRETDSLERMMEKERLSRSMEEEEMPLLLKIMIAIFPFLASWTNMM